MKPLHIALLVCAGALGGAVVTKVWPKHPATEAVARVEQPAPPVEQPVPPVSAPAPASAAPEPFAAPPAAPGAAGTDKPSPVDDAAANARDGASPTLPDGRGSQTAGKAEAPAPAAPAPAAKGAGHGSAPQGTIRWHKNPPPAHPRPVELGQAIPPKQIPVAPAVQEPAPAPIPAREPAPEVSVPAMSLPAAEAPRPEGPHSVTLNAGMLIPVRLVDGLSSERNLPGDTFIGTLDHELVVDGFVIAERGARVEGRVVAADRGTKVKGNAAIAVELTRLHTSDGQNVAIQTDSFERHSAADHGTDAVKVGGGAVIGAIIGAIAGGGKGAAIGAGAGAGAGGADVMLTRKPAALPSETRITFRLRAPVTLTERKG